MNHSILPVAEAELAHAALWYDNQRLGLGDDLLRDFHEAVHRILAGPDGFVRMEGYTGRHDVRRCLLSRFPYTVIFLRRPEEVVILAVSHVRRRPLHWLNRLGSREA